VLRQGPYPSQLLFGTNGRFGVGLTCWTLDRFGQVYTLEKVLRVKKDPASGMAFLDEAMKVRRFPFSNF
jgi:hypothetical protein